MAARILIIRHGALGDMIQSMGPIAAIRAHHADANIVLLTTPPFEALATACPWIDEVWLDPRPKLRQAAAWLALRRRIRTAGFTRVYDLQTSGRSSFYFHFFPRWRRPEWSGIAVGASHFHANPHRDEMHTIDRQRDQLRMAGIAEAPAPDLSWLTADTGHFGLTQPYALVIPGGSAHRPGKRWPAPHFADLCARIAASGLTPAIIGGPDEAGLGREVSRASGAAVADLTGRTSFAEVAALARDAAVAVGNDTGPMHIAAAVGCPAVVLFSEESDPRLCAPRGSAVQVMRQPQLRDLQPDRVWQAAERLQRQIDRSACHAS